MLMKNTLVNPGLALACLLIAATGYAFDQSDDVSNARDLPEAERYPWSRIDRYSQSSAPNYHQMLGALERVRGQLRAENDRRVAGQLTRVTYQVPEGEGSEAPFVHMKDQLQRQGIETLFECAGRSCGSSSYWANQVFSNSILYGPDDDQFYWAGEGSIDGKKLTYSVYAIERGNRRIYLQVDRLEMTSNDTTKTSPTGLQESIVLNDLVFQGVQLDSASVARLVLVADELKATSGQILLVGHYYEDGKTVEEQQDIALQHAEAVESLFRVNGIAESRMQVYSVGPLAPRQQAPYRQSRVELLINP